MGVSSMTGFAEVEGRAGPWRWRWEARSVNGKGFDLRLKLPEGREALEGPCRRRAADALRRGTVGAQLRLDGDATAASRWRVDPAALAALAAAARAAAEALRAAGLEVAPVAPERLLALRGAMEADMSVDDDPEATEAALLAGFDALLERLAGARDAEGAALTQALRGALARIAGLRVAATAAHARQQEAARGKLREKVSALIDAGAPEERLAQELALLAVKLDVREELDRLAAHCVAAEALLKEGGAVGRKLDFLTQEFNREANTLCAKSASPALTEIGLELKVAIDQLREQAQNVA